MMRKCCPLRSLCNDVSHMGPSHINTVTLADAESSCTLSSRCDKFPRDFRGLSIKWLRRKGREDSIEGDSPSPPTGIFHALSSFVLPCSLYPAGRPMMASTYHDLAFLLAALVTIASAGLSSQQIQAMRELCAASNPAATKGLNRGWNCTTPHTACSFDGIRCDSTGSFITSMYLWLSYINNIYIYIIITNYYCIIEVTTGAVMLYWAPRLRPSSASWPSS